MAASSSETKRLLANQQSMGAYKQIDVCMEWLRALGLSMTLVMLVVGQVLTRWPGLAFPTAGGVQGLGDTYIDKLFGFSHTCVFIDFNPSKTVAAILLNFGMIPLMIFTYLNQARMHNMYCCGDHCLVNVNTFSRYTWKFRILCFMLFSMVFVNSPDGEYIDPLDSTFKELIRSDGWQKYLLHYIPYFLYQLSLALMSIEQTWYHYCKGSIFNIPKPTLLCFNWAIVIVLVYYTVWILGFIFGFHVVGHTYRDEEDVVHYIWVGKFIMFLNLVLTTLLPAFMSLSRVYGWFGIPLATTYAVTISPLKKQDEKDEEN